MKLHHVIVFAAVLVAIVGLSRFEHVESASATSNMNGKYLIASGAKQNVPYNDDYASKGYEYFDLWAPEIATHYGEVFWTSQGNQPLPDAIIKRFAGKVIALMGYEQDQVMVQPTGQPGVNPKLDVSVPINWAYNHHYMAWMTGNYSFMQRVVADPNDVMAHGAPMKWTAVERESAAFRDDPSVPTSQMFSEGNGGESRKSYHGYPQGYAQLIESPNEWHLTPMQIDTRNRDYGCNIASINNGTRFIPGVEPRQARYGRGAPKGTNYSGILECPCNGRYGGDPIFYDNRTKIMDHQLMIRLNDACATGEDLTSSGECFASAATLGLNATRIINNTVSSSSSGNFPAGCSVVVYNNDTAVVTFNPPAVKYSDVSNPAGAGGASSVTEGQSTSGVGVTLGVHVNPTGAPTRFVHSQKGQYCGSNHDNVLAKFVMAEEGEKAAQEALSKCEAYCEASPPISMYTVKCDASDPYQQWHSSAFTEASDSNDSDSTGYTVMNGGSGMCLSTNSQDPITVEPCASTDEMLFVYDTNALQLRTPAADAANSKCVDLNHGTGPDLDLWQCHTDGDMDFAHQRFEYKPVSTQGGGGEGGGGLLESKSSPGMCVAVLKDPPPPFQPTPQCTACSVDCSLGSMTKCQWVAIPSCGTVETWAGLIPGDISRMQSGLVTITATGPEDGWFGIGFNAQHMADQPYTLIINSTGVMERKIGTGGSEADHDPGTLLSKSVTIVSNTVSAKTKTRTMVLTRAMEGLTSDHYSFEPDTAATINFITAIGSSQVFAYHKAHAPATISLVTNEQAAHICDAGAQGDLCEAGGTGCDSFVKTCVAPPDGTLLSQHNPTCTSRSYGGGLRCCTHKRIMLDADQPIRPELLRYHMKFRFWFQEFTPEVKHPNGTTTPPSHYNLPRLYQQTEANAGEYDVPPAFADPKDPPIVGYPQQAPTKPTPGTTCTGDCPNGEDCECVHTITYMWNTGGNNMRLIYAGGHCHAPSCIKMELYRNDTGELLCRQIPVVGQGNVKKDKYDEAGYIAIPPCLWGEDKGLEPSQLLPPHTPLLMVKHNRNTHTGHFGEMASWQMRGVNF